MNVLYFAWVRERIGIQLKLGKLICLYDDNNISIDGEVGPWFADDTPARFEAYGWRVIRGVDGHDAAEIEAALAQLDAGDAPTLVCCKTIIGYGSPNRAGTAGVHGAALGSEEIAATRKQLSQGERKPVDKAADYIDNNQERLQYDQALAHGLPIATGVIEGACRHLVKDRMEIDGGVRQPVGMLERKLRQ